MTNQSKAADTTAKLMLHFGKNYAAAERVLDTIDGEPERLWRAEDLFEAAGVDSMMELLMIVARLTYVEMIVHPAMGGYAALGGAAAAGRSLRSA